MWKGALLAAWCLGLAGCAIPPGPDASTQTGGPADARGKPLGGAPIGLSRPATTDTARQFNVVESDLWRVYVINATDDQILGFTIDDKQVWFDSPFTRTCAADPVDSCLSDEDAWRTILIQGCLHPRENVTLLYRDGRNNQIYRTSTVCLAPSCATRGMLIMFGQAP